MSGHWLDAKTEGEIQGDVRSRSSCLCVEISHNLVQPVAPAAPQMKILPNYDYRVGWVRVRSMNRVGVVGSRNRIAIASDIKFVDISPGDGKVRPRQKRACSNGHTTVPCGTVFATYR
jgi:hypothetical protein